MHNITDKSLFSHYFKNDYIFSKETYLFKNIQVLDEYKHMEKYKVFMYFCILALVYSIQEFLS